MTSRLRRRVGRATLVASVLAVVAGGAAVHAGNGLAHSDARSPFVFAPTQGVGPFDGFGVQLNQHVYADISGPPSNLPALEREVLAFRAPVRIFFNTTEWTFPDRMASFARTVALAHARVPGSTSPGRAAVFRSRSPTCPASPTCWPHRSARSVSASSR